MVAVAILLFQEWLVTSGISRTGSLKIKPVIGQVTLSRRLLRSSSSWILVCSELNDYSIISLGVCCIF